MHFCPVDYIWLLLLFFVKNKSFPALLAIFILTFSQTDQTLKYKFIKKQKGLSNIESRPNASLPCLFLHLQWCGVMSLSPAIFVPFYLILCCFVGSGCLMLNEDQITKALFWSRSTTRQAWNDKVNGREMLSSCLTLWLWPSIVFMGQVHASRWSSQIIIRYQSAVSFRQMSLLVAAHSSESQVNQRMIPYLLYPL